MASVITPKELERQGKLCYEGYGYKVFLIDDPTSTLTAASLATEWEALEVSGGGYAAETGIVGSGSYNTTTGRWEQPSISWTFAATGAGFTFTHRALLLSQITTADLATAGRTGGTATITTAAPHGFEVGDVVTIAGAAVTAFNGTWTITATPAWDSFQFALSGTTTPAAETGTATRSTPALYPHSINTYSPAVTLASGQARGGTILLGQDN